MCLPRGVVTPPHTPQIPPTQLFGFEPSWLAVPGGLPQPVLPEAPRGVRGTMSCIRSADGNFVTATLVDGGGVAYAFDSTC